MFKNRFGGIGACIVPDSITAEYIQKRTNHKSDSIYFRPDENAPYVESYDLDLSKLDHFVALYPSPDNVVPVTETSLKLDGCFIGACTTTEEDLILAALVLKEGLKEGLKMVPGLKRVTPGSSSIIKRLEELDLLQYYEKAGYVIGAPGCSYCVGMGVDKAGSGEVWLSSQNRNYRDRMGPGKDAPYFIKYFLTIHRLHWKYCICCHSCYIQLFHDSAESTTNFGKD